MMGSPLFTQVGESQEYRHHHSRAQLEVGGGKPRPDDDGQNEVVGHGAQCGGQQPQGKVLALARQCLADNDGGQPDDDGAMLISELP